VAGPSTTESDHRLLERFTATQDGAAFAALVDRHGPLVLAAARRVLGESGAADDVFQAAFLLLARRPGAVRRGGAVGSWLYGTAFRLALRARTAADRRRRHEHRAAGFRPSPAPSDPAWRELMAVLDEELRRLSEAYRAPLVACYLQGRTRDEAARELGWSVGTLRRRLDRARELLRLRLTRRGATLAAGLCATAVVPDVTAAVPRELAETVSRCAAGGPVGPAVAALLPTAGPSRVRVWAGLFALVGGLAAGAGLIGSPARPDRPADAPPSPAAGVDLSGDPLPAGSVARLGAARFQNGSLVNHIAYTPDGRTLVTVGWDGVVRVWEADTGRELRAIGGHDIRSLAVSPDGRTLATGEYPSRLRLWDLANARELRAFPETKTDFWGLAFSPDGRTVASWDANAKTTLLWDVAGDRPPRRLEAEGIGTWGAAFSPDGKFLAVASNDTASRIVGEAPEVGAVRLWEVATGREERRLTFPNRRPTAIAFAPKGGLLAASFTDGTVHLYDVAAGRERPPLRGIDPPAQCLAFSPDGAVLAAGTGQGEARGDPTAVSAILLWDVATGAERRRVTAHQQWCSGLAFAPDGKSLASCGGETVVRLWDPASGRELRPATGHRTAIRSLAVSPADGSVFTGGYDGTIRRWDHATGRELGRVGNAAEIVNDLAVSPDGKTLASAAGDGQARLWELATGKERLRRRVNDVAADGVAFAPDGRTFAADAQLLDAATGEQRVVLRAPDGTPSTGRLFGRVRFTPDGAGLFLEGPGGIGLWDAASGRWRRTVVSPGLQAYRWALSPDGRLLATGSELVTDRSTDKPKDPSITLWEVATGQEVVRLRGHESFVVVLAFSHDGRTLASGSGNNWRREDETVRVWDVASGRELRRLDGHKGQVTALAFAADGRFLASGSEDATGLVWDLTGLNRTRPAPPAASLEQLWDDLAADPPRAHRAGWALAASGEPAVRLLAGRLRPATAPPPQRLAALVAALDSDRFADRTGAAAELERLGPIAGPALQRALAGRPSAELRRRAEELLAKAQGPATAPNDLRELRAVAALERGGGPEARRLLTGLAGGAAGARLTREAQESLRRLAGRRAP
jgi:RNA polymerase sigma factor (sigma-70 family)